MADDPSTDTPLAETISALDDAKAVRLLDSATRAGWRDDALKWSPELGRALREHFGPPAPESAASRGELARGALLALAADPQHAEPIRALIAGPAPTRFALDPVSGTLLISAALFVLQSHIEIERDKQGRWTFKFKKEPTSESLLKPLIQKLVALIVGGPPTG